MKITLNLKHHSTLIRFYNWVKQWRDRLSLSTDNNKNNQPVVKKLEPKHHDESS